MHASEDDKIPSRSRRLPLRFSIMALSTALAIVLGLVAWLVVSRVTATHQRNAEIRHAVCAVAVPGTAPADAIRRQYKCGPYVEPAPSSPSSTSKSASAKAKARASASRRATPGSRSTPTTARRQAQASKPRQAPAMRPSSTHRAQQPRPRTSTTPRRTPSPTATSHPPTHSATPKPPARQPLLPGLPLPSPLCTVVFLAVC